MLIIMPSGSYYCYQKRCGIYFWGVNDHDAVWHLALAATSFLKWPFIMPIYSGVHLSGYNYMMDLFIYILNLLNIPIIFSYFKLLPLIWFSILTVLAVLFARKIKDSPIFIMWFLFFVYFGSSFGYVFTLYHNKSIAGSSGLLSMQSGHMLTNMQYALSLVFLLLIFLILKEKLDFKKTVLLGILIFVNLGLKFYAGVVSLVLVYLFFLLKYLGSKNIFTFSNILFLLKNLTIVTIFFIASLFIFFNPLSAAKTGSIFIFSPFATMHSLIEEPIFFYLKDMVNARYYLYAHSSLLHSPRLMAIELLSSLLFLFFSMRLRVLGVIYLLKKIIRKQLSIFDTAVSLTAIFCYLFLVLFIQKGQWWNVIQFYYYFLFFLNIYTAEFFYELTKEKRKNIFKGIVIFIAIFLTLPGNIDLIKNFAKFPADSYVSKEEIKGLNFLKKMPLGPVLTSLYEKKDGKIVYPQSLYLASDNSYVPAFSSKPVYLADPMVLQITGINYEKRYQRIKTNDCSLINEVSYIYQIKNENSLFFKTCLKKYSKNLIKIFENSTVIIFNTK